MQAVKEIQNLGYLRMYRRRLKKVVSLCERGSMSVEPSLDRLPRWQLLNGRVRRHQLTVSPGQTSDDNPSEKLPLTEPGVTRGGVGSK